MSDTWNVTASYSKSSYTAGETITATIAGDVTHTADTTTHQTVGPVTIPVVSSGGSTSTITLSTVDVATTQTATTHDAVLIDTSRQVVDTSATPRNWVVSADRRSITATA